MKIFRSILAFLLVLASFGVIAKSHDELLEFHTDAFYSDGAHAIAPKSGAHLKILAFGFDNFVADLYWIRAVQYVGGHARDKNFPILEGYANTITDIDPQFTFVYHFAGLLLPEVENVDGAIKILQKGEANVPTDPQIPFDLGYTYYYYHEDYDEAIAAFERCVKIEGCLSGAPRLIDTLRARTGRAQIAFMSIVEQLKVASPVESEYLMVKLEEIGKLLILQEIAKIHPPKDSIDEYLSMPLPDDENIRSITSSLEEAIQKKLVSPEGNILSELLRSQYKTNPFIWDHPSAQVILKNWQKKKEEDSIEKTQ